MKTSIRPSLKSRTKGWLPAFLVIAALMLSGAQPVWADNDDHDSRDNDGHGGKAEIVRPDERFGGKTYGQWAATWWQWVYSIPSAQNPLTDSTGAFAQVGQNGPVFFLAGNQGGTTVRECTVPAGKALFFPILNLNWVQFPTDPIFTIDELRAIIGPPLDNPRLLSCEIDGKAVRHLRDYRVQSPVFSVMVPAGNLLGLPPGTYAPCVDDGYYVLLEPLKQGRHTIHIASQNSDGTFSLDVTYHLNVVKPAEVVPPNERYHGRNYAEWSAKWWEWFLEYPVNDPRHPHPGLDANFDAWAFQDFDDVWFLTAPLGAADLTLTVPDDKALFFALLNVEVSSLEAPPFYGANAAQQRARAKFFADHIVNLSVTIDGAVIGPIGAFRALSSQFRFDAPTPWFYGATGGRGTSVGDGYYVLLEPLSKGEHTMRVAGAFHFDAGEVPEFGPDPVDLPTDTTYHLKVK